MTLDARKPVAGQETNPPSRFLQHPHRRRSIQPFPIVDALAQNRPQQLQRSIYRRITAPLRELRVRDPIDERAADVLQVLAAQELIEPTKLGDIFLGRRLVRMFLEPAQPKQVPDSRCFLTRE